MMKKLIFVLAAAISASVSFGQSNKDSVLSAKKADFMVLVEKAMTEKLTGDFVYHGEKGSLAKMKHSNQPTDLGNVLSKSVINSIKSYKTLKWSDFLARWYNAEIETRVAFEKELQKNKDYKVGDNKYCRGNSCHELITTGSHPYVLESPRLESEVKVID